MNNQLSDILEICLQEIENGADVEAALARYPEFAEDLRPILETSIEAKSLAVPDPSPEVVRRNRSKVLQQAAQMREVQARPSRRLWSVPLRRALVSLAVISIIFIGTNGLVHASAKTLPGDNLYPVKRSWEDVQVMLTFNTQARTQLEVKQEDERLNELNDLFEKGRSASVEFTGTLTGQNGNLWQVANIPVLISAQTNFGGQTMKIGNAIRVTGLTQAGGTVLAEHVVLLPAGAPLPEVDDSSMQEIESENSGNQSQIQNQSSAGEDHSNDSSATNTPQESETQSAGESTSDSTSGGSSSNTSSKDSGSGSNNHSGKDDSGGGGSNSGSGSDD